MLYGTISITFNMIAVGSGILLTAAGSWSLFSWMAKREKAEWEVMKPCPTCGTRRREHQSTPLDNLGVRELRELRDAQTNKFQPPNPAPATDNRENGPLVI